MNINELTKASGISGILALKSATETLREKGVLDFGPKYDVQLKMRASEAFKMAISPTTDALETLILFYVIVLLLIEMRFDSLIYDFDRAIDEHLRKGGLAAVPGVIPEPPLPESDLAERVLKTLITLEDGGLI